MIFVTVGTHEQPFDRLVKCIDALKENGMIAEEVVMQTGYCTYAPKYCKWGKLFPHSEMARLTAEARIVITHGGPSSFLMPLQLGKIPIVVPRRKEFGEHVNDHQVEFCRAVEARLGNIIPVYDIEKLAAVIRDYNVSIVEQSKRVRSNNAAFNNALMQMVDELMEKG